MEGRKGPDRGLYRVFSGGGGVTLARLNSLRSKGKWKKGLKLLKLNNIKVGKLILDVSVMF